jgi:predicted nucleotidyltransferase
LGEALEERRRERDRLVDLARDYVERLAEHLPLVAAAVVGSVARGDFNVWSDIDVIVVAEDLPLRAPDRGMLLAADAPAGVQVVGFTPDEFRKSLEVGNPLAREAVERGIVVFGDRFFEEGQTRRS